MGGGPHAKTSAVFFDGSPYGAAKRVRGALFLWGHNARAVHWNWRRAACEQCH